MTQQSQLRDVPASVRSRLPNLACQSMLVIGCAYASAALADGHAEGTEGTQEIEEIEEVVVVAPRGDVYASAASTDAMRRQQTPLTSVLAVADSLPGVSVHEGDVFGFDDWSTTMSVRGFQLNLDEQQLGMTVDGMPNGNSNYGGGAKANRFVDTLNLSRVVVSQGTADLASRSNEALGGTLDFVTDDPHDERRVTVSLAGAGHAGRKGYVRYDTGTLAGGTRSWLSASRQSATDWIDGTAENDRVHAAGKVAAVWRDVDVTAYAAWDDVHEDNYQRLFSAAAFAADPEWDRLTARWTALPHVDQANRRAWSTLRENAFAYAKADAVRGAMRLSASVYGHHSRGRGDWAPPYLADVVDDGGGPESEHTSRAAASGGQALGRIHFVDDTGRRLFPRAGCVSSIGFPYGGAGPEADPDCHAAGGRAVQSYRHTHYAKLRWGASLDLAWEARLTNSAGNRLRGGLWYENARREERRDWHEIADTRAGAGFEPWPYWVQYSRRYPATTVKAYVENTFSTGPLRLIVGAKRHRVAIRRRDGLGESPPVSVVSASPVLWSAGATAQLPARGLEAFAGYADNYKAFSDLLLERPASMLDRIEPETARNVEFGVRYLGERGSFAATLYEIAFRNRILFVDGRDVAGPDFLIGTEGAFVNAGGVESRGIELVGRLRVANAWWLYGAYTADASRYVGTGDAAVDASLDLESGNRVAGIPEDMLVVSLERRGVRLRAGATHKVTGGRTVDAVNAWHVPTHATTHLYVETEWEARPGGRIVRARATVNNLFDTDHLGGIAGAGAWIGPPRTVSVLLEAELP